MRLKHAERKEQPQLVADFRRMLGGKPLQRAASSPCLDTAKAQPRNRQIRSHQRADRQRPPPNKHQRQGREATLPGHPA